MKVKVTTLTGDKHELEVAPHDTAKQIKKSLHESGKVTSQVRLLQGKTILEDDRKLFEYSLPEGAAISALLEPDVDIKVEVSIGKNVHSLNLSNATSIMALKVQICGVMRCGVTPESVELKFGEVTLEDSMPLHFYGITDDSKLKMLKPYVTVTIENNQGAKIYWRLHRKETIREVKVKLASVQSSAPIKFNLFHPKPDPHNSSKSILAKSDQSSFSEIRGFQDGGMSAETMRLYSIKQDHMFFELNDEKTTETYNIKDDDKLYLLPYRWTWDNCFVRVKKTGKNLQGVELGDTCLAVKLRAQEQLGIPVSELKLFKTTFPGVKGINTDKTKAFNREGATLEIGIEEDLRIERARKEEEWKAQQARPAERRRADQAEEERRRAQFEEERLKRELEIKVQEQEHVNSKGACQEYRKREKVDEYFPGIRRNRRLRVINDS